MSDTDPTPESDDLKVIRHSHEVDLPAERQTNALLQLENFGLRTDIDFSTREGEAWAATYKGDWNDVEAAKADYATMFPTGTPTEPVTETTPVEENFQTGMTDDLRNNQGGQTAPPGTTPDPHPVEQAFENIEKAKASGAPEENARHQGLSTILQAAAEGDERVIWSEDKKDQMMEKAPW